MIKSKIAATAFLVILLTTTVLMIAAEAQAPTQKTYPLIDAIPNPVGVGEQVLIRYGISEGLGSVEMGWEDITVTIVDPDGDTEVRSDLRTDSTGSSFSIFTPDKAGTWTLTMDFPEQEVPGVGWYVAERGAFLAGGTVMLASSISLDLVVQEEPLTPYPDQPLPSEYWTRPIDPQLRSWYQISGNWVERPPNSFSPYNDDAPETAHVLWAKPMTTGGLTGGLWTDVPASAETGDAYEGKFQNSVIISGVLYYNVHGIGIFGSSHGAPGVRAIDLRTGEELWFRNNTSINFGQILYFNSFNYDGVFEYLWNTAGSVPDNPLTEDVNEGYSYWDAKDPFTGEWMYRMTNVPSGVQIRGPSGEILRYVFGPGNSWLALWNSTAAGETLAFSFAAGSWGNVVHGNVVNASVPGAYSWNVSLPAGLTYDVSFGAPTLKVYPDRIVAVDYNQTHVRCWALNIDGISKSSTSTTTIFDRTRAAPSEWLDGYNTLHYVGATDEAEDGVIAVWSKELRKHYGYSTKDGTYLWETESEIWLDWYGWGNVEHTWYFAYDHLYSVGVGGIFYAYDLTDGTTTWTYNMTDAYNEPVTGSNWWGWITNIADGKIYVGTVEHSAEQPLPRGGPYICLNATDGSEIWRVNGMFRATRWGGNAVMGDSIIATMDTYDQRVYAIGKGPSATTITAPDVAVEPDTPVIIKGTVTDISPGTNDAALKMRFPNGVPAVADESMSAWMLYVYKQFARPADAVGVNVTLSVLDANNNCYEIGTATTDADGFFTYTWLPVIPGDFTVYASFEGTNGYWPSRAVTSFTVMEAPEATPPPTPTPAPMTDTYVLGTGITLIIILVVGIVVIVLMLRRR